MLAGKRVHKQIILAMVTAVLLLAATSQTARATSPYCGAGGTGNCYDVEFINYFSNANPFNGLAYLRIIDPLEANSGQNEEICSMIYVFDPKQNMQECCGCPVTPDGLLTLSYGFATPPSANPNSPYNGNLTDNPVSVGGQFFYYTGPSSYRVSPYLQDGVIRIVSTETNASTSVAGGSYATWAGGTAVVDTYYSAGTYCDRFTGNCCDPAASPNASYSGTLPLTTTLRAWADHIQQIFPAGAPDPLTGVNAVTTTAFEEAALTHSDANNLANLCRTTLASTGNGYCNCGSENPRYAPAYGLTTGGDGPPGL